MYLTVITFRIKGIILLLTYINNDKSKKVDLLVAFNDGPTYNEYIKKNRLMGG
ncbi:hypothetical protein J22TS1_51050 [Siminovitchia terrae]|nr:hypothetical protein J22TS1_51050 [Siminovitchia terrae]